MVNSGGFYFFAFEPGLQFFVRFAIFFVWLSLPSASYFGPRLAAFHLKHKNKLPANGCLSDNWISSKVNPRGVRAYTKKKHEAPNDCLYLYFVQIQRNFLNMDAYERATMKIVIGAEKFTWKSLLIA